MSASNFFENFVHSIAASRKLLRRAHDGGFLIEGLILYAELIDALLRNLVAHSTAVPKSEYSGESRLQFDELVLDDGLFQQGEKMLPEKAVYKMALANGIINKSKFDQLYELYDVRNKIVHRFIISDIAYSDLEEPLKQYELMYQELMGQLSEIEQPDAVVPDMMEIKSAILQKLSKKRKD